MESIDMLIAFILVAFFMLGVYALSSYFAVASQQNERHASVSLDAQEILKKIIVNTGEPSDWTNLNQVLDLGLADLQLPGQLDSRKLLALATASGYSAQNVCVINTAGQDYFVTKIGYGIYLWASPGQQNIDAGVYERILRSFFGDQWSNYDIELVARPALNISLTLLPTQVLISIKPPGEYQYDLCYFYWSGAGNSPEITGAYIWQQGQGKKAQWYFRVDIWNPTAYDIRIIRIDLGEYSWNPNIVIQSGGSYNFPRPSGAPLSGAPSCLNSGGCTVTVTYQYQYGSGTISSPVINAKPAGQNSGGSSSQSPVVPSFACVRGSTDASGNAGTSVSGNPVFAFINARGMALKGINYTYSGGSISLIGLVARPEYGVYLIHSKLIQNIGSGVSLCGCDDTGVSALGLRGLWLFLGGQTAPLLDDITINPSSSFNLGDICQSGEKDKGGCLIPWSKLGRAKFLIAAVERNSNGDPPKCGGIPQRDVIVMPLAGGLPPLYEIRFATWRRWVNARPEAVSISYAEALADSGEITYKLELWVYRYR